MKYRTAPLTVTAQSDSRGYDGSTLSAVAPITSGTTYDAVGTAATQTFDTKHAGTGKTLTATGLVMNDGNSGNNYSINPWSCRACFTNPSSAALRPTSS